MITHGSRTLSRLIIFIFILLCFPSISYGLDENLFVADGYDIASDGEVLHVSKDGEEYAKIWKMTEADWEKYGTYPYGHSGSAENFPYSQSEDYEGSVCSLLEFNEDTGYIIRIGKLYFVHNGYPIIVLAEGKDPQFIEYEDATYVDYPVIDAIQSTLEKPGSDEVVEDTEIISFWQKAKVIDNPICAYVCEYFLGFMLTVAFYRRNNRSDAFRKAYPFITGMTALLSITLIYQRAPGPLFIVVWAIWFMFGGAILKWANKHPALDPYIETEEEGEQRMMYMEQIAPATNYDGGNVLDNAFFRVMSTISVCLSTLYCYISTNRSSRLEFEYYIEFAAIAFMVIWISLITLQMFMQTIKGIKTYG